MIIPSVRTKSSDNNKKKENTMTIRNLTPHALNILGDVVWPEEGDVPVSYKTLAVIDKDKEFPAPRLKVAPRQSSVVEVTDDGVEISVSVGSVIQPEFSVPLPPVQDGVKYVVSYHCLVQGVKEGRKDLLSPGRLARDEGGNPIGCDGLTSAVWVD